MQAALIEIRGLQAPQSYLVILRPRQGGDRAYRLTGDEWRVDAQIIVWHPWLLKLGLQSIYRLERLENRYRDRRRQQRSEKQVHDLPMKATGGLDPWDWLALPLWRELGVRSGSGVYAPLVIGARYEIRMGPQGLYVMPLNLIARRAMGSWNGRGSARDPVLPEG